LRNDALKLASRVVFGIAQKIAVLHQGHLIADGTPEEVRNDPEVRRVYLGHGLSQ